MKLFFVLLFLIGLTTNVSGQRYLTADIRTKADSILRIYVQDSVIYEYCIFDSSTYYEYKNRFGKIKWETLTKSKRTKGNFLKVDMRWNISIPFPECKSFNKISGSTSLALDSLLRPANKPNLDFIPDFYYTKDSCHLISEAYAIVIAKKQNLKAGIDALRAEIKYNVTSKTFTWEISQTLWLKGNPPGIYPRRAGAVETVTIDALTGKVYRHETYEFSTIH